MLEHKNKNLINKLFNILTEINEEAINNDEFHDWLSKNYPFKQNLEEIIVELKNIREGDEFNGR